MGWYRDYRYNGVILAMKLVTTHHLRSIYGSKYFGLSLRVAIGAIFLLAGLGKVLSGEGLFDVVSSLTILPFSMIVPVSQVLPWLEIALGLCFLLGLFPAIVSAISLPLISAFIIVNIFNLQKGLAEPCSSCFGSWLLLSSRDALIMDVFLLLAVLRLLTLGKHFMSLDSLRLRKARAA